MKILKIIKTKEEKVDKAGKILFILGIFVMVVGTIILSIVKGQSLDFNQLVNSLPIYVGVALSLLGILLFVIDFNTDKNNGPCS